MTPEVMNVVRVPIYLRSTLTWKFLVFVANSESAMGRLTAASRCCSGGYEAIVFFGASSLWEPSSLLVSHRLEADIRDAVITVATSPRRA